MTPNFTTFLRFRYIADPAATAIQSTGRQLVSLSHSFCAEVKTQILKPLMISKYFSLRFFVAFCASCTAIFLLTELNKILDRHGQWPSQSPQRAPETFDTSSDESDKSRSCWKILSKKRYRMKKTYGMDEFDKFFVTGPIDAAKKLSLVYFRTCRKNVSVWTHGYYAPFPGESPFSPSSEVASWNTWVTLFQLPSQAPHWRWTGAAEGRDPEKHFSCPGASTFVHRRSLCWWGWSEWPELAPVDEDHIFCVGVAIRRELHDSGET